MTFSGCSTRSDATVPATDDDDTFERPAPRKPKINSPEGTEDEMFYDTATDSKGLNGEEEDSAETVHVTEDKLEKVDDKDHHPIFAKGENRLRVLNDKLETAIGDIKNAIKTTFKEVTTTQKEFGEVANELVVVQRNEHKEAERLVDVDQEVSTTLASWATPGLQGK